MVEVKVSDGSSEYILASRKGQTIRFPENSISATGRNTIGSQGIKLESDDKLINMNIIDKNDFVVSLSETGAANRIAVSDFKRQNRNGKGFNTVKADNYRMIAIIAVKEKEEILLITEADELIKINLNNISLTFRHGYMYGIEELGEDQKIKKALKLPQINASP